jgi:transposase
MSASARCVAGSQLVRARSRAKNEIHAVLMRCLKDRPPVSDLFGVNGRRWLAEQQLPVVERETVDSAVRQVEFLDTEIAAVEQLIAADALGWPQDRQASKLGAGATPGSSEHCPRVALLLARESEPVIAPLELTVVGRPER